MITYRRIMRRLVETKAELEMSHSGELWERVSPVTQQADTLGTFLRADISSGTTDL